MIRRISYPYVGSGESIFNRRSNRESAAFSRKRSGSFIPQRQPTHSMMIHRATDSIAKIAVFSKLRAQVANRQKPHNDLQAYFGLRGNHLFILACDLSSKSVVRRISDPRPRLIVIGTTSLEENPSEESQGSPLIVGARNAQKKAKRQSIASPLNPPWRNSNRVRPQPLRRDRR